MGYSVVGFLYVYVYIHTHTNTHTKRELEGEWSESGGGREMQRVVPESGCRGVRGRVMAGSPRPLSSSLSCIVQCTCACLMYMERLDIKAVMHVNCDNRGCIHIMYMYMCKFLQKERFSQVYTCVGS